ncbi:hypothetical protein G195_006293, partial [Phytophthora kernoviae 00238/432]
MDSDEEEQVQLELAAEVRSLRHKLRTREQEVNALQEQMETVTTQLHETSEELEHRMEFVVDAMTQIESLEAQVAEAKRSVLTYEMQLHERTQRERAVEAALQGKEKQCEYWESEFHRVDQELSAQMGVERELKEEIQAKNDDMRACKAKLQAVISSVDELKQQNASHRKKERTLVITLRQQVEAAESSQRSWKVRLAKRELKIESLRRQCQDRQKELDGVERERKQESEVHERHKLDSQSDLEKLNVDENMPEMERVEKLLKTGLDRQKISILNSLPKILASNNTKTNLTLVLDCMKGVWQKFESEMNADPAVLLEIFKTLASLACTTVDGKVLSYPIVTFHEEYAEQLEACRAEKKNAVFLLTDDQIAKLLVPFVLDIIAEIQQKDYAEDASLALIAMLPRVGTALKKTQMMALCQDTDGEVRRCMCVQLDGLARAVGEEHACTELLPELLELLQDEEEQVKQTAFLALLSLFDFFPARDRVKLILPEFINMAESQPDYLVRHYIAAGIHEVAALLGQQRALRYLKGLVLNLINDESPNVQGMAISRVPQLLSSMVNPNDEEQKDSSADSKWSSMLEYTLVVGKDGQVVRRARVKSFDLVNKIVRMPGKDTGRTAGMNVGGGGLGSGLGMGSNGSSSMALGMSMGAKLDTSKTKTTVSKSQNKLGPTLTTLPNCTTARPGHAKMPQAIKVANSTGKIVASGSKSAGGPTRTGTSLPKDVGAITKIPIIRPSAPAKREVSPPASTKPSSATLTLGSGSS